MFKKVVLIIFLIFILIALVFGNYFDSKFWIVPFCDINVVESPFCGSVDLGSFLDDNFEKVAFLIHFW